MGVVMPLRSPIVTSMQTRSLSRTHPRHALVQTLAMNLVGCMTFGPFSFTPRHNESGTCAVHGLESVVELSV
jgi:hypothetical protein